MVTPASQGAANAGLRAGLAGGADPRTAERLRAMLLGPRGGSTTRRRASDAFRFGLAVAAAAVSIPVIHANSAVELDVVPFLNPPPAAIQRLLTAYLPPIWGWATLAGMRRREYV